MDGIAVGLTSRSISQNFALCVEFVLSCVCNVCPCVMLERLCGVSWVWRVLRNES